MKILELVMIVKNSGEILRTCLEENKKFIDYWTILDTGSTDNTIEIINETLNDIPGKLFHSEFTDFSTERNKALDLSSKTCKYTIILDDSYIINGGFELLQFLKKSDESCFAIKIGNLFNGYIQNDYYSKRIIRTSDNLKYIYRVHEDIDIKDFKYIENKNIFVNDIIDNNHKERSFIRYKNDIKLLLLDYEKYPKNPRIIYYIAKTYQNIEDYENALKYYEILKNLKNIDKQYLFSSEYEISIINFDLHNDIEKFKNKLHIISEKYKNRFEPLYKLAVIYKDQNNIKTADYIISKIINFKKIANPITIIENEIIDYFIPYLYIEIKILLCDYDDALIILKRMLDIYPHNQPLLNIKYNLCDYKNIDSVKLSDNKTIVIHTGGGEYTSLNLWNPKGDKKISGSEYMAINLCKEFLKYDYRVFIIGNFENNNINFQCIHEGIEYIDYKYFLEFALTYVIDILIISRYASNLVYYNNIKKVYLWIHDVLPAIDNNSRCIQIHKDKFKGIIAISEWQKNNVIKKLNIQEDNIILSRNAIYIDRFINKNIQKVPFRFIYSSCPTRGLSILINIVPKIKERYPQTTLYIFVRKELIDDETLKNIKKLDYVFLNNRLSQDDIAIEFLKSDIWLYPTDFKETYCITALEAMASKCLVATVDYCGLGNIVKGKGVICDSPIDKNIDNLLEKLFFVLDKQYLKNHFIEKAYKWASEQTFENLALEWINNIF